MFFKPESGNKRSIWLKDEPEQNYEGGETYLCAFPVWGPTSLLQPTSCPWVFLVTRLLKGPHSAGPGECPIVPCPTTIKYYPS